MKTKFQKLVKPTGYQVYLFTCPAQVPFIFAVHPWFVCVRDGKVSRWEVRHTKDNSLMALGRHLYCDALPPFVGIEMFFGIQGRPLWQSKLLGKIEGGNNSPAQHMYNFIVRSSDTYQHKDRYLLWGPNSNTYAQWVLDNNPDFSVKLPTMSIGKNYPV